MTIEDIFWSVYQPADISHEWPQFMDIILPILSSRIEEGGGGEREEEEEDEGVTTLA